MVVDGAEKSFCLEQGFWRSIFGRTCVVGQYIEDNYVVFVVGCVSDFVVCLPQFVSGVFVNVVFVCWSVLFFVYQVQGVLNVVCSEEFVIRV